MEATPLVGVEHSHNGLDRIDSNLGYVSGNVVTCCTECNRMKLSMPYNYFINKIKDIYNHMKLQQVEGSGQQPPVKK